MRDLNPFAFNFSFTNSQVPTAEAVARQTREYEADKAIRDRIHNQYWVENNTEIGCPCGCQRMEGHVHNGLDRAQLAVAAELEVLTMNGFVDTAASARSWDQQVLVNEDGENLDEEDVLDEDVLAMEF